MHPLFGRGLHPNWGVFVQIFSSATSIVALATLPEQSELRRIARGLGCSIMPFRLGVPPEIVLVTLGGSSPVMTSRHFGGV